MSGLVMVLQDHHVPCTDDDELRAGLQPKSIPDLLRDNDLTREDSLVVATLLTDTSFLRVRSAEGRLNADMVCVSQPQ